MTFTSGVFLIFFSFAAILYWVLPAWAKKPWLLAASYFYYMFRHPWYGILLAFCTLVTFAAGRSMGERGQEKKKILVIALVLTLSVLCVFKYTDFALQILNQILSLFPSGNLLREPGIALPAERNIIDYALFVSFFPQLLAGPIGRAKSLLPQLKNPKLPSFRTVEKGFLLFLWGAFLKLVIADRAGVFVDTVYDGFEAGGYAGSVIVLAVILFGLQLYCDFYGYTMMAAGCAGMLGIELAENFSAPYLSASVQEFWRRWHISLSTWFRDYLYIPLGGSRCSRARKYGNLMMVFLVSGLWHGASWSFVFWGALNGLFLVLEEMLQPFWHRVGAVLRINTAAASFRIFRILINCFVINFTWIFFRGNGLAASLRMIQRIFASFGPGEIMGASLASYGLDSANLLVLAAALLVLLLADLAKYRGRCLSDWLLAQNRLFRELVIAGGGTYNASGFIYFQF